MCCLMRRARSLGAQKPMISAAGGDKGSLLMHPNRCIHPHRQPRPVSKWGERDLPRQAAPVSASAASSELLVRAPPSCQVERLLVEPAAAPAELGARTCDVIESIEFQVLFIVEGKWMNLKSHQIEWPTGECCITRTCT